MSNNWIPAGRATANIAQPQQQVPPQQQSQQPVPQTPIPQNQQPVPQPPYQPPVQPQGEYQAETQQPVPQSQQPVPQSQQPVPPPYSPSVSQQGQQVAVQPQSSLPTPSYSQTVPQQGQYDTTTQPMPPQQPPTQQPKFDNSDQIGNVHGRDVVLDFKDKFRPSESYAAVYGKNSVIGVTITNYGNSQQRTTVHHNIAPCIVEAIESCAMANAFKKPESETAEQTISAAGVQALTDGFNSICSAINELNQSVFPHSINNAASQIQSAMQNLKPANLTKDDFFFSEVKVNSRKPLGNGYCPVSTISITRTGYQKSGEASKYPWFVTIENFEAVEIKNAKGMSNYDSRTKRNTSGQQTIKVADKDMFALANKCRHFIDIWVAATSAAGIKRRVNERKVNTNG